MIKLSIVTLSYNTKDLMLECIKSISSQYRKELEKKEFEIIVVDNASSDGSPSGISRLHQDFGGQANFKLIKNKENVGFARGCNIGAKAAKGKYILFLNSDTKVLDNGFIEMVKFMNSDSKSAILGGRLENNDGSVQRSCGKFYNLFNLLIMLLGFERFGFLRSSPDKIQKIDWVSGACMMIKRNIFEKLNGFDEKLFMYVEDMEICYRARKLGFLTYFYPFIKLRHKSLGSSNRTFAIINIYKGILQFYSKHKTSFEYLIAKTMLIAKAEIMTLVGLLTFSPKLRDRYRKAISQSL